MKLHSLPTMPPNTSPFDFLQLVNSWPLQAKAYKACADKLVEVAAATPTLYSSGNYLLPVAFLYRHYLELMLKGLLWSGVQLEKIEVSRKILKEHYLGKIWTKSSALLADVLDTEDHASIDAAGILVREYDEIDESSAEFRYPRRKDGTLSLSSLPSSGTLVNQLKHLNLSGMKSNIEDVHKIFDRANEILDAIADGMFTPSAPT
jgi:hypothetical protein